MVDSGWRLNGIWKILSLKPQGHIDQADQGRHLYKGPDNRLSSGILLVHIVIGRNMISNEHQ